MENDQHKKTGHSRFSRKSLTTPLNKVLNTLFLAMVVFFIFEEFVIWTGAYTVKSFALIWNYLSPRIITYTPPVLLCILILDACLNGLRMPKSIITIIGILLVVKLNGYAYNNHFEFFFWYVIAYPTTLSFRKAAATFIVTSASLLLISASLTFAGVLVDVQQYQHGVIRHSLGFFTPNAFSIVSTTLVMVWIYCKSPVWNWRYALASLSFLIIFLTISDGRSAFVLGTLQIAITSFFSSTRVSQKLKDTCSKAFFKCSIWLFPIFSILSIALLPIAAVTSGTSVFNALNTALSGRLSGFLYHFNESGIPLFSQPFRTIFPCDNAYLSIVWSCGVIALVFFAALYIILGKTCEIRKDLPLAILTVIFLVHCMTEAIVFLLIINFTILAIGSALANPYAKAPTFATMQDGKEQNG